MTRAVGIRLLLTALAVVSVAIVEGHMAGLWSGTHMPLNIVLEPSDQWVVLPLADVPLPASLRGGDVLSPKDMSAAARIVAVFGPNVPAGTTIELPVMRDGAIRHVSVTSRVLPSSTFDRLGHWLNALFVAPLVCALALLTLWRGRGRASGALCAFAMASIVSGALLTAVAAPLVSVWLQEAVYLGQFLVPLPALYVMAEALADSGLSLRTRRAARLAVASFAGAGFGVAGMATIGFVYGGLTVPHALDIVPTAIAALLMATALLVLLVGYRRADHESRLRIRWVLWSTALFLAIIVGLVAISPLRHPYLFQVIHSMMWLALVGYFYAAFRNRLVDVSFVVNRALVYAALTALLFGIFSVLELGLHQLAVGEKLSWALQAVAAMLLAVALSPVHRRVEHRIERLFFRKQRQAISAIRAFATECAFVEQGERLLQMAVERLRPHCSGVAVYERGASGYLLRASRGRASPEILDVDDPAFVSLRAQRKEVDLRGLSSAAGGDGLVLPMSVGERVTGAVICHPRDAEQFAPDERAALAEAARNLGMSLYLLRFREQARLLADVAAGRMDLSTAQSRAAELIPSALV